MQQQQQHASQPVTDNGRDTPLKPTSDNNNSNSSAVFACSLYSFCSVSMVLVNKSLASRYVPFYLLC